MSREAAILSFLDRHGYVKATAAPLAQDASFRRYLRLTGGPRPAVLMDAPPPEDIRPFLRIASHLAGIGLSVPEIIAADAPVGLVLEEDLGDGLFSVALDRGSGGEPEASAAGALGVPPPLAGGGLGEGAHPQEQCSLPPPPAPHPQGEGGSLHHPRPPGGEPLSGLARPVPGSVAAMFSAAIDALVVFQRAAPPPDLPAWDSRAMGQTALGTLLDWWWPAAFGAPAPPAARDDFAAGLHAMLRPLAAGPYCAVHRDFFAGNLIWLPERAGARRVGILDFQGMALGHPAYDLVSLLQDARRDISPALATGMIDYYLAARPELDPVAFDAAYAVCAAQRHLRVACQWVRLALRDRRPHYLSYGPRTWRLLEVALHHPAAAPIAAAMNRWIPPSMRANPKSLAA